MVVSKGRELLDGGSLVYEALRRLSEVGRVTKRLKI